jgi:hypothetical protein
MNLEVRILNELWVRFAEVRILKDLGFWTSLDVRSCKAEPGHFYACPMKGVAGSAVCKWMRALGVPCGRLLGPRKRPNLERLCFEVHR